MTPTPYILGDRRLGAGGASVAHDFGRGLWRRCGFGGASAFSGIFILSAKSFISISRMALCSSLTRAHAARNRWAVCSLTKACIAFLSARLGVFGLSDMQSVLPVASAGSIDKLRLHAYHAYQVYA